MKKTAPKPPRKKKDPPAQAAPTPFVPRIVVKNFGPLKDVDLELKDFMVFIGPQASGKSTLAKLVYYHLAVREKIFFRVFSYLDNDGDKHFDFASIASEFWSLFKDYFPTYKENKEAKIDFYFTKVNRISITISTEGKLSIEIGRNALEPDLKTLFGKIRKMRLELNKLDVSNVVDKKLYFNKQQQDRNEAMLLVERSMGRIPNKLFVPAGRGIMSYDINSYDIIDRDKFFKDVIDVILRYRRMYTESKRFNEKFESVIGASYLYARGRDLLQLPNGTTIPLMYSSSGQQEAVWLLLLITNELQNRIEPGWYIIEEPEAHLFPPSQNALINYTALWANTLNHSITLTTHSPYVLTSLNNLLYAGHLSKKFKDKPEKLLAIEAAVPKEQQLDPDKFECYYVDGGLIETIKDPETGMIHAERIDAISAEINRVNDQLLSIEFDGQH